jgi:hypothetical protein
VRDRIPPLWTLPPFGTKDESRLFNPPVKTSKVPSGTYKGSCNVVVDTVMYLK